MQTMIFAPEARLQSLERMISGVVSPKLMSARMMLNRFVCSIWMALGRLVTVKTSQASWMSASEAAVIHSVSLSKIRMRFPSIGAFVIHVRSSSAGIVNSLWTDSYAHRGEKARTHV